MRRIKPQAISNARRLRSDMTEAEKLLWHCLRKHQIDGCKFRRQHPVGRYIADFVCLDRRLILEEDGGQHGERQDYDKARSDWLRQNGYRVIRFWNNEVMSNIEGVKAVIYQALREGQPNRNCDPHPTLPLGGGRRFVRALLPGRVRNLTHIRPKAV